MKKSPILILIVAALVFLGIVFYRYQQYVLIGNFLIDVDAPCNPLVSSCFMSDCTPGVDLSCDQTPYVHVEVLAKNAPPCLAEHSCQSFSCSNRADCTITYCSKDTLSDGEVCSVVPPVITSTSSLPLTASTTPVVATSTQNK